MGSYLLCLPSKGPKFQKSAAPGLVLLEREETAQKFVSVAAPTSHPIAPPHPPAPDARCSGVAWVPEHRVGLQARALCAYLGFAASGPRFAEGLVQAGEGVWRDVRKGLAEQNPH